mgnify:CR=1 FL=1
MSMFPRAGVVVGVKVYQSMPLKEVDDDTGGAVVTLVKSGLNSGKCIRIVIFVGGKVITFDFTLCS